MLEGNVAVKKETGRTEYLKGKKVAVSSFPI